MLLRKVQVLLEANYKLYYPTITNEISHFHKTYLPCSPDTRGLGKKKIFLLYRNVFVALEINPSRQKIAGSYVYELYRKINRLYFREVVGSQKNLMENAEYHTLAHFKRSLPDQYTAPFF